MAEPAGEGGKDSDRQRKFRLGEQPEWANTEPAPEPKAGYIADLLSPRSSPATHLLERGFCVVEISPTARDLYARFHSGFERFCRRPRSERAAFAALQFDAEKHSPNQFHGYSEVDALKCQFMMRLEGSSSQLGTGTGSDDEGDSSGAGTLAFPEELYPEGLRLFELMDTLCRGLATAAMRELGLPEERVAQALDPVAPAYSPSKAESLRGTTSPYLLPGYISSSIMDTFYYFGTFEEAGVEPPPASTTGGNAPMMGAFEAPDDPDASEKDTDVRHVNNHAAHTDSGLLTAVIVTDTPALEVLDQSTGEWVALELHLHEYCRVNQLDHRSFATVFWSDSVVYLREQADRRSLAVPERGSAKDLVPCLHRVARAEGSRVSIVYKQRSSPLRTAPRYQEDYMLAKLQLDALEAADAIDPALERRVFGVPDESSWIIPAAGAMLLLGAIRLFAGH
jgi:hypothetical protein